MRVAVRDSTALAAGSAVSGLLAYVFFALVTRTLGAEAAAPVSVLWTYWSFAAAFLTFPLQHWIVRSVTARGAEDQLRAVRGKLVLVVVTLAVVAGGATWLVRERLFYREDALFPLMVGLVTAGSALMGTVRGVLTARERHVAVAWALVLENALRCLVAVGLILVDERAAVAYGLGLVAGQLVGFLWPGALRLRHAESDGPEPGGWEWLGFLAGAAGGQLSAQAVLTGGPVVLALMGGTPAQVTALFAALALFRAPYTLAIGVLGQVTGRLTSLVVLRDRNSLRRWRQAIVGGTAAGVLLAALVGGLAGPWLVALVFGESVVVSAPAALLTAVGSALALGNLVLTAVVMALDRAAILVRCWIAAAVVGGLVLLATDRADASALVATCAAFAAAEAAALAGLLAVEIRGTRRLDLPAGRLEQPGDVG
jgi:O-antigen/teichoic acid export membrane protein